MIGPYIANTIERLIASEGEPYIPRNNIEDIELDFGGTLMGFSCPPASPWLCQQTSVSEASIDLMDKSLYAPPSKELIYTHSRYCYCDVFYREWRLYGDLLHFRPIACASLAIKVVKIPKVGPKDTLFDFDHSKEVFPTVSQENFPDLVIRSTGGGLLRKLCPTRASFNSVGHQGDNERQYYFRIFIVLDSEHMLVLDFYLIRSPKTSTSVLDGFKKFLESIENTLYVNYSSEVNDEHVRAEVNFSERHDCDYDEEFGPLFAMDLD